MSAVSAVEEVRNEVLGFSDTLRNKGDYGARVKKRVLRFESDYILLQRKTCAEFIILTNEGELRKYLDQKIAIQQEIIDPSGKIPIISALGVGGTGAAVGAAAGSAVPIFGTLIGGAVGFVTGLAGGAAARVVQKSNAEDEKKRLVDLSNEVRKDTSEWNKYITKINKIMYMKEIDKANKDAADAIEAKKKADKDAADAKTAKEKSDKIAKDAIEAKKKADKDAADAKVAQKTAEENITKINEVIDNFNTEMTKILHEIEFIEEKLDVLDEQEENYMNELKANYVRKREEFVASLSDLSSEDRGRALHEYDVESEKEFLSNLEEIRAMFNRAREPRRKRIGELEACLKLLQEKIVEAKSGNESAVTFLLNLKSIPESPKYEIPLVEPIFAKAKEKLKSVQEQVLTKIKPREKELDASAFESGVMRPSPFKIAESLSSKTLKK
ncbi:MAG: hypothetical protein LBJ09_00365 [Clostridiales bacterium]|jgi:hypothetical protein|nr:hypothetical protein [Clostridiales bacterium]